MVRTNIVVIILSVLAALVLAAPLLASPWTDTESRSRWENSATAKLPPIEQFVFAPKAAFQQLEEVVEDYQFGGEQIIRLRRTVYFDYLGVTGDPYIVKNDDGAVFLTAPFYSKNRDGAFAWWRRNCFSSITKPQLDITEDALSRAQDLFSARGAKVVFVVVPSKSAVLSDSLPPSTPQFIKDKCSKLSGDVNWVSFLDDRTDSAFETFYPFDEFRAQAARSALFYPHTSYHWQGESTWVLVNDLADHLGLSLPPEFPQTCTPMDVHWDIGRLLGVRIKTEGCDRAVSDAYTFETLQRELQVAGKATTVPLHVTRLKGHDDLPTALIYGNSFVPPARAALGHMFRETTFIDQNVVNPPTVEALLGNGDLLDVDYVIVLGADFHYPSVLNKVVKN